MMVLRHATKHSFRFTALAPQTPFRNYAVSVNPPKTFPGKSAPRRYPEKKSVLYHRFMRLLDTTSSSILIFMLHADFTAQRLSKLRKDIIIASGHVAPSLATTTPASPDHPVYPTLTVLQTSVFGAALRDFTSVDAVASQQIAEAVKGPLAVLSLPQLDPPQLSAVLRALDRGVPPRKPKTEAELEKERREKTADPATPGRRVKKVRPMLQPELRVVGALVERRLFTMEGLQDVSKLPSLGSLRSQIVQLLGSPSTQLAAVLSEAGGGKLSRTLEGLKKGLEDVHTADQGTP